MVSVHFLFQEIEAKWNSDESRDEDNSGLGCQFDSPHKQHVVLEQQSGIVEYWSEVGHVSMAEGESDVGEGRLDEGRVKVEDL